MLIKNGLVCDSFGKKKVDIRLDNGTIVEIGSNLSSNDKIIDASDKVVVPSLVDLNIAMESISLNSMKKHSSSAIKGGVFQSLINPKTLHPVDNEMIIEFINTKNRHIDSKIIPMCDGLIDSELNNISSLIKIGAKSVYIESSYDLNSIRRVLEYAKMLNIKVFCRCNEPKLALDGVMSSGKTSSKLGLPTISKSAEFVDVAKVAYLADSIGVDVVFQTLSTSNSVDIIDSIQNIKLKKEISIHHLLLSDEVCDNFNTYGKNMPPLRDNKLREDIIKMLQDGKFDVITSQSRYFSNSSKDKPFAQASFGIDSIEFYYSLLFTLSQNADIDFSQLIRLASYNTGELLGIEAGKIKEGLDANLVIIDPNINPTIDINSPYYDKNIKSKVVTHIIKDNIYNF